jgi:hypothetical protein
MSGPMRYGARMLWEHCAAARRQKIPTGIGSPMTGTESYDARGDVGLNVILTDVPPETPSDISTAPS